MLVPTSLCNTVINLDANHDMELVIQWETSPWDKTVILCLRLKIAKAHVEFIFLHTVEVPERSA